MTTLCAKSDIISLSFVSGIGETLDSQFYLSIQRAHEATVVIVAAGAMTLWV